MIRNSTIVPFICFCFWFAICSHPLELLYFLIVGFSSIGTLEGETERQTDRLIDGQAEEIQTPGWILSRATAVDVGCVLYVPFDGFIKGRST